MHACWLIRGISLLDRRHYEEALESFDRYLLFDAGSYLGWVFRAATLARLNRHEEALTSLDRALELRPDDSVSWQLLARTLGGLRRFEDALANLNRALELKPDEAESWRVRGLVLANLGRLDQALASYDRATELRPAPSPAWAERAAVLALLDRWEDAARSLERAVEMPRCEAGVWVLRGVVLAELKQYDEAVRSYNRALELAPGASPESRSAIGEYKFRTRLAQGRPDLAELEWLDLATAPARPEGWRRVVAGIAWEAARRGRLTLARQILEESETAQQLRPLGRAVQYLLTGDEALVEKLSPEVRGIVDEIVQRLRLETGCQEEPRKPPARSEAAPRTRRKAARE
jgi:tetratricopeptide (TPR) repeat protein